MGAAAGRLYHPDTGTWKTIHRGFSWPCLFLGPFWYASNGMGVWTLRAVLLCPVTLGVSWLVLPFFANRQRIVHLLTSGFLPDEEAHRFLSLHHLITRFCPVVHGENDIRHPSA